MLRHYLAAALRYLGRNRLYSAISVFGLAVGLWGALLAVVEIRGQFVQSRFVTDYENAYQLITSRQAPDGPVFWAPETHNRMAELLRLQSPQVEGTVRLAGESLMLRRGAITAEESVYWADPSMFRVLPMPVVAGDPAVALDRPDGLVMSRSMARKYFGRDDPIGQTILLEDARQGQGQLSKLGGSRPMQIGGVVEDLSGDNSIFGANVFVSGRAAFSRLKQLDDDPLNASCSRLLSLSTKTVARLKPGASIESMRPTLQAVMDAIHSPPPSGKHGMRFAVDAVRIDRMNSHPGLHPDFDGKVLMVGVLGSLVLLIACVNFVNLLTARSTQRAIEVGVRKVAGASRRALVLQFLGEASLYSLAAMFIAVALTEWSLPAVNAFLDAGAEFHYWRSPLLIAALLGGALLLALLAGAYPAFVLSGFRPLQVMKGLMVHSRHAGVVRQILVTLQFAMLIGLVICAGVVYLQRIYATQDMVRVNTDQVLVIRSPCQSALVTELRAIRGVHAVACSGVQMINTPNTQTLKGRDGKDIVLGTVPTELRVFDLFGIAPIAGILPEDGNDEAAGRYVINEAAVHHLGFSSAQDAVGKQLQIRTLTGPAQLAEPVHTIAGVVPDFSFTSVARAIEPIAYAPASSTYSLVYVKFAGREIPETLESVDRAWKSTRGEGPISHMFLDEHVQQQYLTMLREAQAFGVFAIVAVLLACLGLLGLSASTVERRTKEIGIRKAMGAETRDIVRLLLWQFSKPVLWANVIAWPLAALGMRAWLKGFVYHIDLPALLFPAAALLALVIALATVAAHSVAVARARPVTALRYE